MPNGKNPRTMTILMAEDDPDDRVLTREAMETAHVRNELRFVNDGQELIEYLRHEGEYAGSSADAPLPGIILLDLNMPRMDGREALAEIKGDPELRHIPIVVLTTSKAEEDIVRTYDLGVNSFITKPVTFNALVEVMQTWSRYWFEIVDLPPEIDGR
ncbi:MAG TPA: response regulator [Solirubrobacterales bacterium]|nr:response regulator [Solirubrobacterales bacterium]